MASAFHLNQFSRILSKKCYKINYLIRREIRGPRIIPRARVNQAKSLAQILQEQNVKDPEVHALVEIGLPTKSDISKEVNVLRDRLRNEAKKSKELYRAAKSGSLRIDLDEIDKDWFASDAGKHTKLAAQHYNIYSDLFHHGIFTPAVPLDVQYPFDDETVTKVFRGNVIFPEEASTTPSVTYPSDPNDYWTLVLTNIDGNMIDDQRECLHWLVGNIKGNELSTGEEIFPYLQPYPLRGVGYQRMAFVLYLQNGKVDYSDVPKPPHKFNLESRNFRTFDFYQKREKSLTPAGLVFFQTVWDESVKDFFHNCLEMKEPVFEYDEPAPILKPQKKYPIKRPFNKYLDKYRDIKDIRKEVLLMRLKTLNPFEEESPMPKYPNIYHLETPIASWQKPDLWKQRNRIGKFKDLRPYTSYPEEEFEFQKHFYEASIDKNK